MIYKEYNFEQGRKVDLSNLIVRHVPKKDYSFVHQNEVIVATDVLIWSNNGFLLIKRNNPPAKGELWPVGGRLSRGVNAEESIIEKSREECGLDLKNLKLLGIARTYFGSDPLDHGKGTDTLNLMYVADGFGKVRLDAFHDHHLIVSRTNFEAIREKLHPYVRDYLTEAYRSRES